MSASETEAHGYYNICEVDPEKGDDAPLVLVLLRDTAFFAAVVAVALAVDSWTAQGG